MDIALSLAARVVSPATVDAWWRRQMAESAALSLVAFPLLLAAGLIPAGAAPFINKTPRFGAPLFIGLAVVCVAGWAVQWLATLKLARLPRYGPRPARAVFLCVALVTLATVYTVLPLVPSPRRAVLGFAPATLAEMRALVGPACVALYYLRLAGVLGAFGATGPAAQARVLALCMPFALGAFRLAVAPSWGPVGPYVGLPSFQHGVPWALFSLAPALASPRGVEFLLRQALPVVVSSCGTYLLVRLLFLARAPRQPVRKAGPGDSVSPGACT